MDRGNVSFIGDAFKFGPRKALSLLNGKLRNDKTISNFLSNRKYDKLAGVARALGYGKKKPKRRMKGGADFMEYVLQKVQDKSGMTREEAKRHVARETGNNEWLDDSHTDRSNRNPFASLANGNNWEIAASIGKNVVGDVIAPVVAGKVPNPFDVGKIVYDGVKKVNGKGRRKRKGMRKIRVVGGRIDTPLNKGLLL